MGQVGFPQFRWLVGDTKHRSSPSIGNPILGKYTHLVGVSSSTQSARTKQGVGHSWSLKGAFADPLSKMWLGILLKIEHCLKPASQLVKSGLWAHVDIEKNWEFVLRCCVSE